MSEKIDIGDTARFFLNWMEYSFDAEYYDILMDGMPECDGHPAGPFHPMGETVYCDGSCKVRS